jgi:hypothetical protein
MGSRQITLSLKRLPDLASPLMERHAINQDGVNSDYWVPYPTLNQSPSAKTDALLGPVMASLCELTILSMAIQEFLSNPAPEMNTGELWQAVNSMWTQLQLWQDELPALLRIQGRPVPQALLLR